jgi:hypothetical protein
MMNLFKLFFKLFALAHNLHDILISFTVDSLIKVGKQICGAENAFFSCYKGNKKGLSHFMKILAWNKTERKVKTFVLNIDVVEGTLEGCTEAIKHSTDNVAHRL